MSDIDHDELRRIRESQERVERWLVGDERGGQPGLIKVVKSHDGRINRLERVGVYLAGAAGVLAVLWTIWSQWPR